MVISPVVGHGHVGVKMGARTGGHGVARVDSDHAECGGVSNRINSLRFIGFCHYTYPGAGGQYEIENISGYVARRFTKISEVVAGDEPGTWPEDFRYLTKGI